MVKEGQEQGLASRDVEIPKLNTVPSSQALEAEKILSLDDLHSLFSELEEE